MTLSRHSLHGYALLVSLISILYHFAECGVSIFFGIRARSNSLVFFGAQSGIEIVSSFFVIFRFWGIWRRERDNIRNEKDIIETEELSPHDLKLEKFGSLVIGALLVALSLTTIATAIHELVLHSKPETSDSSIILSASVFVAMFLLWLPKRYLAKALDSSVMKGETTCTLSCLQLTVAVFVGAMIYKYQPQVWWADAGTSLVLALLFAWEGYKTLKWASSASFNGSCCAPNHSHPHSHSHSHSETSSKENLVSNGPHTTPLMCEEV